MRIKMVDNNIEGSTVLKPKHTFLNELLYATTNVLHQ